MEHLTTIILMAVALVVLLVLWRKGFLLRMNDYVRETKEELRKCTWPNWDELRGSTIVVLVAGVLLGGFTVGVDFLFTAVISQIT